MTFRMDLPLSGIWTSGMAGFQVRRGGGVNRAPKIWGGEPQEGRVMWPILILSPLLATPITHWLHSNSAHLWAPEKAGVR